VDAASLLLPTMINHTLDEIETGADRLHALGKWSPTVHPAFDVLGDDEVPF
jgi:hypothetical protein